MTRVSPGGPADEAGLKEGDKIMQVCSENSPQGDASSAYHVGVDASVKMASGSFKQPFPYFPGERLGHDHGDP